VTSGWQAFCRTVAARGDHPALVQGDVTLSFGELGVLARQRAAALVARGVGPGDRVVLHLANGADAAALPAALWATGAVPVLAPGDLRPEALADIAARTGARGIVSDVADPCATAPVWHPAALTADALAGGVEAGGTGSIVFTSGSTGRPKGVVQRQSTLMDGAARVAQAVGFGAGDRLLCAVPWSHDYGWTQLLALYRLGVTLVLPATPGLALIPETIERHRPTVLGGVPSVYAGMTRGISDIARRDRSSVRLVMSTGSAMPARVWDDLGHLFAGARRCLNYGLTETFRSATLRPGDEEFAPGVVGSALPGSALCIVDADGVPLPQGAWGQIVHRGAGVFEGYWDDPDQTALRRRPDPVTGEGPAVFTGDRGMLDAAGRLTVGDRIDRVVKVMGLAASPLAVEAVLQGVPGVAAAAVVSRPHDILGAELHAVLVAEPGLETAQPSADAAAKAGLPLHERPRRYHMVAALPLTASGKVDLVALSRLIGG
jgi:acyl-coenzyme A synthetase/AMP-(fatty) acid ligase